jgi:ABC-2 type transport system ATP-binding protein
MPAVEVEQLTKQYGPSRGVADISFSVEKGEIMGFLGPNGSGKTTTMRMLTCFFPPTRGTARICGYDIRRQPLDVRRCIGYLPESVPLYREMPVQAYLRFFAEIKGVPSRSRRAKVDESIERCGLQNVSHRIIGRLSKGYRQRVGLAQALLHDPEVLILDEPTVGLDPKQIIEIRSLIKELGKQQTVILSTHILPEVSMTCDRVIIIHEGRLIAVDTPANLMQRLQQTPQLLLRADGPAEALQAALADVDGVLGVEHREQSGAAGCFRIAISESADVVNALARTVWEHGWRLREIRPADMSLEDIFIQLVTNEEEPAAP